MEKRVPRTSAERSTPNLEGTGPFDVRRSTFCGEDRQLEPRNVPASVDPLRTKAKVEKRFVVQEENHPGASSIGSATSQWSTTKRSGPPLLTATNTASSFSSVLHRYPRLRVWAV